MKKKQVIRITESQFHQIVNEVVKKTLNEIDVAPPKRNKRKLEQLKWLQQEYPDKFSDNIQSDFPEEWLSDDNYIAAHKTPIKMEKPKYDKRGFDLTSGLHKTTGTNYDEEGYNILGIDKDGFTKSGRGLGGYDKEGYDKKGLNKEKTMYKSGRHNWREIFKQFIYKYYYGKNRQPSSWRYRLDGKISEIVECYYAACENLGIKRSKRVFKVFAEIFRETMC